MSAQEKVLESAWVAAGVAQCADLEHAARSFARVEDFEGDPLVRCALMESGLMALRRCFKDGQPLVVGKPGRWTGSAMMRLSDALVLLSEELAEHLRAAIAAADGVAHRRLDERTYQVSGDSDNLSISLSSELPFDDSRTYAFIAASLYRLIFDKFSPAVMADLVMAKE